MRLDEVLDEIRCIIKIMNYLIKKYSPSAKYAFNLLNRRFFYAVFSMA